MMRTSWASARRFALAVAGACVFATSATAQIAAAPATPCLQKLQEKQAKQAGKKKASKVGEIFGTVAGAAGGFFAGRALCKDKTTAKDKTVCVAAVMAATASIGNLLGSKLDQREQKTVTAAAYSAAFTGRPQALTLNKGCALVETSVPIQFERRDVELALANGISSPPGVLRAVGEIQMTAGSAQVQKTSKSSAKPLRKLPANSSSFVMGSVNDGKWLLLGQGSEDTGYVASGYAPATGWLKQPNLTAASEAVAPSQSVRIPADLPCWTSKITIRSEGGKAQQDTLDTKLCRGPDGTTEAPQADQTPA